MLGFLFSDLRHVVGGVYARPLGIESRDLALVVVDELDGLGLEVAQGARLREGGHLVGLVTLGGVVKSYTRKSCVTVAPDRRKIRLIEYQMSLSKKIDL